MKKLFAIMMSIIMVFSLVAVLAACDNTKPTEHVCKDVCPVCGGCTTECEDPNCANKCPTHDLNNPTTVQEKVYVAGTMSLEQLEAAAKEEFEAQNNKFKAEASTSGVGKALAEFAKKYDWFQYDATGSAKDEALLTAIGTTIPAGSYWCDFALLQKGLDVAGYVKQGALYSYLPKADSEVVGITKDAAGLVGALYADKLFVYNKANFTDVTLTNVWQLTGKNGAGTNKAMPAGLSFQNPTTEGINAAFLAMMTSPDAVTKLTAAYESYFGTKYVAQSEYPNIGYYFVHEFISNIKAQHTSDGTALSAEVAVATSAAAQGRVYILGLNKSKSYPKDQDWKEEVFFSGIQNKTTDPANHLEGFDGFSYKFYMTVPKTARLPYTACLVARYLCTEEGFLAGWNEAGYYSANTAIAATQEFGLNDKTLLEDPAYIASINTMFNKFMEDEMAALSAK